MEARDTAYVDRFRLALAHLDEVKNVELVAAQWTTEVGSGDHALLLRDLNAVVDVR